MIVKKFVCDRCSNEITGDNVFTIAIEEKPKDKLDDLGVFEDSLMDAHFCPDCKNMILAYICNEVHENVKIETIVDDWEPEELKVQEPKENEAAEVVQASAPKRHRATRDRVEQDKQIARSLYAAGKPIGEIARSLGHTYQCVRNWLR